jgi:hypothetical protein
MFSRWLLCLEAVSVALLIYCAETAGRLRFKGRIMGFDEAYDTESHLRYFVWHLRSREAFLFVLALWVAAILLAVYKRFRAGDLESGVAKYGSQAAIAATLIVPIAALMAGFILGFDFGM